MRDKAGRDPRRVMGAHRRERQRAAQYCRHEQDDLVLSGHGFLRASLADMACRNMARAAARRLAGFEVALAENSCRLADFEIYLLFQWIPKATRPPR
jgi:hypothetical protein